MSFIKKTYPKVVMAKKVIITLAAVLLFFLITLIFINIYRSSNHGLQQISRDVARNVVADVASNVGWYDNLQVRKPLPDKQLPVLPHDGKQIYAKAISQEIVVKQPERISQVTAEEMKKILYAPITSNQINDTSSVNMSSERAVSASAARDNSVEQEKDDQNMQREKKKFLKANSISEADYLQDGLKNPVSPYEVKAGTIIPAVLLTGINSDLPGQIIGQVRSNVYDTISGRYVVIPQGAKLIGIYDSQIAYGQSRLLVVWKRIIYPNGQSISLEGMPGVDMSGYAGFNDQVNNHYMKIFGSVILMSVISAGAQLSQPQNNNSNSNTNPTVNQTLAASLGTNIMNSANMMMQKNLGVQPTLIIRPGYLMNVSVTKDIVFPGAYQVGTNYSY